MDPVTAGGLAIGVASLAFDVFDNCVKCFRFLSFMVEMPKDCENCRLRLLMEYNQLLAWGKAVGLIDVPDEADLAVSLGTNTAELSGIISHIGLLLERFREIGERWKELRPEQDDQMQRIGTGDVNQLEGVLSLDAAYMNARDERRHVKGTNHLFHWMSKSMNGAKEIVAHPRRVRWAAVDKDAFEALLKDLHALTARLHQLVSDFRLNKIATVTSETYRELVLAHNDIQEIKDMLGAATAFMMTPATVDRPTPVWRKDIDDEFRYLLLLKETNRRADSMLVEIDQGRNVNINEELSDLIRVRKYDAATIDRYFKCATSDESLSQSQNSRKRGTLKTEHEEIQTWIEWRYNGSIETSAERIRVMTLAQMLHASKPKGLRAPTCVGYIDDSGTNARFGWIFAMPSHSTSATTLRSLHSILDNAVHKPTLGQRITLATKLASSLLYLHTCDWLHKGIHSGNIVFSFDEGIYDPANPIISGFDYSRSQGSSTISGTFEPKWNIYRWPSIQNEAPKAGGSRKTYDIYSLGLVLLEVAHWKPLAKIMCLEDRSDNTDQDGWIRAWLLGEDDPPFESNPLFMLRDIAGDRYWKAVTRCIEAHGERGLRVEEHANQAWSASVGLKLHDNFNTLVVQELEEVSF